VKLFDNTLKYFFNFIYYLLFLLLWNSWKIFKIRDIIHKCMGETLISDDSLYDLLVRKEEKERKEFSSFFIFSHSCYYTVFLYNTHLLYEEKNLRVFFSSQLLCNRACLKLYESFSHEKLFLEMDRNWKTWMNFHYRKSVSEVGKMCKIEILPD
jgi:hypothetical protein